jgi:hypothetical protein
VGIEGLSKMTEGTESSGRSFVERFGGVSAFLAAMAAGIYILGLLSLLVPIAMTYTNDFTAAWYAVSLIPTVTVAGQGVKQLVLGPLTYLLLTAMLASLVIYMRKLLRRLIQRNQDPWWYLLMRIGILLGFVVTIIGSTITAMGETYAMVAETQSSSDMPLNQMSDSVIGAVVSISAIVAPALVGIPVGIMIASAISSSPTEEGRVRIVNRPRFRRAISMGLIVVFAAALAIAAFRSPPLPPVQIDWEQQTAQGRQHTTKGDLLTHVDGYWYVYGENNKNLIAIPDDKVEQALLCSNTSGEC